MSGKVKYYLLIGFIGFLITFAVSSGSNLLATSLIRGGLAFVGWAALAFVGSWMLNFMKEHSQTSEESEMLAAISEQVKGGNLDLTTPDEADEINDLLKQPIEGAVASSHEDFAPLNPPKLVKTPNDNDPEELVKVVRHLTEE
jgi:polyhydroxyalkanoate synthesis regulator protein